MDACREYVRSTKRQITFEYILIKDVTCTKEAVKALKKAFKDVPAEFFQRVVDWGVSMPSSRYTEKAALTIAFLEYTGEMTFKSRDYEATLLDHNLKNFIHYSRGMPPVFNKRNFRFPDFLARDEVYAIQVAILRANEYFIIINLRTGINPITRFKLP